MQEFEKFKRWIEASHILYETFENRHAVYPISLRWVKEWYMSGSFTITEDDVKTIDNLVNSHIHSERNLKEDLREKIHREWKEFMETSLRVQKGDEIGSAISPYLFLWNFAVQRIFEERNQVKELF
jgi:predicted house-cleaning noncanonical NTP pyrophosphatase (MazG superfamily)